jgi:hypothetical protein
MAPNHFPRKLTQGVGRTASAALAAELAPHAGGGGGGGGGGSSSVTLGAAHAWLAAERDREWQACARAERRVLGGVVRRARAA